MTTIHEDMAKELLSNFLMDAEAAADLSATMRDLRDGTLTAEEVAHIGQTHWRASSWPPEQVAAYLQVNGGICGGKFAHAYAYVGSGPGPDSDRAGNAAALEALDSVCKAVVDQTQNGRDSDGTFSWFQKVKAWKSTGTCYFDHGRPRSLGYWSYVPAGSVPLEIGYTKPSRTLLHLLHRGGVARWPYGSDEIHILLNLEHPRFTR